MEKCKYKRIDKDHNTYQCTECGHILTFEADGPFENSTDFCPKCGKPVDHSTFRCTCGYEGEAKAIAFTSPVQHGIFRRVVYPGLVCCPECRLVYFVGDLDKQILDREVSK